MSQRLTYHILLLTAVLLFRLEGIKRIEGPITVLSPNEEIGLRSHLHRLFLTSESGYVSNVLFKCIMEEFTKFCTKTRSGLDCFTITDYSAIHPNKEIDEKTMAKGIHMLNAMTGSSHWFQVQQPFGKHKKKRLRKKKRSFRIVPQVHRMKEKINLCSCFMKHSHMHSSQKLKEKPLLRKSRHSNARDRR